MYMKQISFLDLDSVSNITHNGHASILKFEDCEIQGSLVPSILDKGVYLFHFSVHFV